MSDFLTDGWMRAYADLLNATPAWRSVSGYYAGRIAFRGDTRTGGVEIRDGMASPLPAGGPADITVAGPDAEWRRVCSGQLDWFQGVNPSYGGLTIEGDVVAAMRNAKLMWLALAAMSRLAGAPPRNGPYAPNPTRSGRAVVGRYIEVDGVRTYYEEAGDGYPVVCFHAAGQDTLMYRHVLEGLSDAFRVIAIDAPGHAKSLASADGAFTSLTQHAAFNERLMAELGLVRPVILGCSMAGNMVLELGSRRPDAYAAIVSAEGADFTPTLPEFLLDMLLVNGQQILEGYAQSLTGRRTPPDRAREVVWQLQRAAPDVVRADLAGYAGFDRRAEVGRIEAPVLLIRGEADWLVSQDQVDATLGRLRCAQVAVLEGTGHYPMIENPAEFNDTVRGFLTALALG